ncbi:MAG: nucleotidyltransferase [Planctomycetes bacterium]|nr:nucleotidyltransferase [Planctomycetota bacterium]
MSPRRDPPADLAGAFDSAVDALNAGQAAYAVIGGLAVALHGLPRATRDIDILWDSPRIALPGLLERFREQGFTFELDAVLRELARDHISAVRRGAVRVDLLDAAIPFFKRVVGRARVQEIRGRQVRVATPEDLIAMKLIAGRETDLQDARGILAAQRGRLDLAVIRAALVECCGQDRLDVLEALVKGQEP